MRIPALLAVLLLALTACGETGTRVPAEVNATSLRTKLGAQTTDQCFLQPARQRPAGCEKYVTQLGGVVGSVDELALRDPALAEPGRALRAGIDAYRAATCGTTGPAEPCRKALTDIAAAVEAVKTRLDTTAESR
ncbi:hypothetical protein [Amycolatopsis suaedae]|uniref:Uncharacterized protein n=1 Tax=Amycolatopsis suaedae TaxID=2510978 RepID=A0A4Q7J985_9PSEU|nr:hypothetical protein [Amycolatopsis suaedae]RZQ62694.1 hypothetical protein EWH70_17180 [Amycolatopsis suaedae]